jgi:hypothetical protein
MPDSTIEKRANFICSAHVNTVGKEAFAVLAEPHWLYQLQMSFRIIRRHRDGIAHARLEGEVDSARLAELSQQILELERSSTTNSRSDQTRLAQAKAEVERIEMAANSRNHLIRDVEFLLKAALEVQEDLWKGIVQMHPELGQLSEFDQETYERVHKQFSGEAQQAKITRDIVRDRLAATLCISAPVAESLLGYAGNDATEMLAAASQQLERMGMPPILPVDSPSLISSSEGEIVQGEEEESADLLGEDQQPN